MDENDLQRKNIEFSNGEEGRVCNQCGNTYKGIWVHWARSSDCDRPQPSEYQINILKGTLMGDGNVEKGRGSKNPSVNITNTNKKFLDWVDQELGIFSRGVRLTKTSEKAASGARKSGMHSDAKAENYNDIYSLRTVSHPRFKTFEGWYSTGEKRFPYTLSLTPLILKMWYICDGNISIRESGSYNISIGCSNEIDREEYLIQLFEEIGIPATVSTHSIILTHENSRKMLDYMGAPPVGFEHKWVQE